MEKVDQIIEMYKNLDGKEKLIFEREIRKINSEMDKKILFERTKSAQNLKSIVDSNGRNVFSEEFIKNLLKK